MVQIPTRTRTLSFSVREAAGYGRQRPNVEEPDAKRARRHAPLALRSTPLAPKSVNLTVTAVPVPFPAEADDEWGTDKLPSASTSSRGKKLVAKTTPTKPLPLPLPQPPILDEPIPHTRSTRARTPSPLTPYWQPAPVSRQRRGRIPPEPLARKALKAHFASTPHGAAVIKLGARRAIAQAECVAAVERVRKLSGEKEKDKRPTRLDVPRPALLPPVLMDAHMSDGQMMRFPSAAEDDSSWVPLSVQTGGVPVHVEECDIVEMETDPDWSRV
ncbi:unnamed protein product [Rhizoctonia solani]|uniref:Uncharacterized protein n=1 Tax=Rhizoctonia solani TaxID=456999 RepID=A0A8H3DH37_9AGAM|nr:unnamed protein product [Rhizoctonia solani]